MSSINNLFEPCYEIVPMTTIAYPIPTAVVTAANAVAADTFAADTVTANVAAADVAAANAAAAASLTAVAASLTAAAASLTNVPPVKHPIIERLDEMVDKRKLVIVNNNGTKQYSGWMSINELLGGTVIIQPLTVQRVIDDSEINKRVGENIARFNATGTFHDMFVIQLVIVSSDGTFTVYIMDGQHRVLTCKRLSEIYPEQDVIFQVVIAVVSTYEQARERFFHFNKCVPMDNRTIHESSQQLSVAREVVSRHLAQYRSAYAASSTAHTTAHTTDPNRPMMSTNLLNGLLRKMFPQIRVENHTVEHMIERLTSLNASVITFCQTNPIGSFGITQSMLTKCEQSGCYLGLIRDIDGKCLRFEQLMW